MPSICQFYVTAAYEKYPFLLLTKQYTVILQYIYHDLIAVFCIRVIRLKLMKHRVI